MISSHPQSLPINNHQSESQLLTGFIPWPAALLDMTVCPDSLGDSSQPQPPSHQFMGARWHFPHDVIKLKHPHGKTRGQEGTGDTVAHGGGSCPLQCCSLGRVSTWDCGQTGPRQPQEPLHPSANSSRAREQQGEEEGGLELRTKDHTQGTTCSLLLDPLLNVGPPQTQCGAQGWPCAMLPQLEEGPDAVGMGRILVSSWGLRQVELDDFCDTWL